VKSGEEFGIDAELLHPSQQRRPLHPQPRRRPFPSSHSPLRLLQHPLDFLALPLIYFFALFVPLLGDTTEVNAQELRETFAELNNPWS